MSNPLGDVRNLRRVSTDLATSGQPTEAHLAEIAQEGFEVVVNLALHDDPRYSLPDEAATVESLGMEYFHIPVQFDRPTREDLHAFYAVMNKAQGRKTWVHCAANYRVTAFLGLYWATQKHIDHAEAFALLNEVWRPNEVWAQFIAENLGHAG